MYASPWGHDYAWERAVVRRIRDGGAAPEVYALYEGAVSHETGERAGLATGYVYFDQAEAEERALKNKQFREGLRAAQETARIRNVEEAAERKARAAEQRDKRAEAEARRAAEHAKWMEEDRRRRDEYVLRRPSEIREKLEYANQENRILSSKWLCTVCGGKSIIERRNPGYQIQCTSCGKQAWGSHQSLWGVLSK